MNRIDSFEKILEIVDWNGVKEEFSRILSKYIQFDTSNPPGNETPALEYLKEILSREGFDPVIVEKEKGRGNLLCSFGEGGNTEIILLSHADVVPAQADGWKYHPFSGKIIDDEVWGRGAIDCKGLGVMEMAGLILLRRTGFRPAKKAKLIICADEETGGRLGAGYLTGELKEGSDARYLLNEGGLGTEGVIGNSRVLSPCFGEKGPLWLKIISRGKGGHGSVPHGDNANLKLVFFLKNFLSSSQPVKVRNTHLKALSATGELLPGFRGKLIKIISSSKFLTRLLASLLSKNPHLSAMFRNTVSLTMLQGGYKENVIPEEAWAVLDIRLLPGEDPYKFIEEIKKRAKRFGNFEFKILTLESPSESSLEGPFFDAIKNVKKVLFPDALFVPVLATGFTDSRFFRKNGTQAIGLLPCFFTGEQLNSIHGKDERINISQLLDGIKFITCLLFEILSGR